MATAIIMPRQGQSVESCVIGKWHKQKGDKVSIGDILFTYETDKATLNGTPGVLIPMEENPRVQQLAKKVRYAFDQGGKPIAACGPQVVSGKWQVA